MAVVNQGAPDLPLFSEKAWERILDSLPSGSDVQNVFSVFPELGVRFHKKKTVWLFDQVCPFLFKVLPEWDRLDVTGLCRQVSKRWGNATDTFIQNHPSRRPYDHDNKNRRSVPYGPFNYDDWWKAGHVVKLENVTQIKNFHAILVAHSNRANALKNPVVVFSPKKVKDPLEFLEATAVFLCQYGRFIWNINLTFPRFYPKSVTLVKRILLRVLQCLFFLTNSRKVTLAFGWTVNFELLDIHHWLNELIKEIFKHDVNLRLESFEFHRDVPSFLQLALVQHYQSKIKSLSISKDALCYALCLRDVVELEICFDDSQFPTYIIPALTYGFSLLRKLTICKDKDLGGAPVEINVSSIFKILAVAGIEELDLESCLIFNDCTCFLKMMNEDKYPSLKYLRLTDHRDQDLDFLTAFPSLEQLHMVWATAACIRDAGVYKPTWRDKDTLSDAVRYYTYEASVPARISIWKQLPSLKVMTISDQTHSADAKCARECGNTVFYSYVDMSEVTILQARCK